MVSSHDILSAAYLAVDLNTRYHIEQAKHDAYIGQKTPISWTSDPIARIQQIRKPENRSQIGKTWSKLSDLAGGCAAITAAVSTLYFIPSTLPSNRFPSPHELLVAIAAKTILPLITGVVAGGVTTLTLELCGDIVGRTYQAIAGVFEKKE